MSARITAGITGTTLVLFIIIIFVGYFQLETARQTTQQINATLSHFIEKWDEKQIVDNKRFNATLDGLAKTYAAIIDNQKVIIGSTGKTVSNQEAFRGEHNITHDKLDQLLDYFNITR